MSSIFTVVKEFPAVHSAQIELVRELTIDDFNVSVNLYCGEDFDRHFPKIPFVGLKLKDSVDSELNNLENLVDKLFINTLVDSNFTKGFGRFESRGRDQKGRYERFLVDANNQAEAFDATELVEEANVQLRRAVKRHNEKLEEVLIEHYSKASTYNFDYENNPYQEIAEKQFEIDALQAKMDALKSELNDMKFNVVKEHFEKNDIVPEKLIPRLLKQLHSSFHTRGLFD